MHFTLENIEESLADYDGPAYAVDRNGAIVAWNTATETLLGSLRENVLGKPCYKIIRGKDVFGNPVCHRECLVMRNIRDKKPARRFRMHVRVKDGHHVEAECAALCLRDSVDSTVVIHLLHVWPGWHQGFDTQPTHHEPRASRHPLPPLTSRQMEILRLMVAGSSTQEIADALYISPGTVRSHVENILNKFKVHSRLAAAVIAVSEGLI
jgi:PAS domain S-box-containing protein